jgi:ureidoglycolate lyase
MISVVETTTETRTITAELVSPEAFAPFGHVIGVDGQERLPHNIYGDSFDAYRPAAIEADTPLEWLLVYSRLREFRVLFLERHQLLGQAFIPLGGQPFISVVARPDAREERGIPALDELHAFLVPGDRAIQIHKRTWHEPPFPLVDGSLVLVTSHGDLTMGLASNLDGQREVDGLDVEKRNVTERAGYILKVQLP